MGARVDRKASIIRGFEFSKIRKIVEKKKKYAFHLSILNLIHSLIIRIFGNIYLYKIV